MENIIFLDIDGVLNDNVSGLSLESVKVVKELIDEHNAKVVIISSLQWNGTESIRKKIRSKFENIGIYDIDFIDPNFEGGICDISVPSRLLGIVDYLKNNEVSSYVILDDDYHNDYRLLRLNYYRPLPFKGLTEKDLPKIKFLSVNLNNFQHVNYRYRSLGDYELVTNALIKTLKMVNLKKLGN